MSQPKTAYSQAELIAYTEDMISDALKTGTVDPVNGLECFLYALDLRLVSILREFVALSPKRQEQLLDLTRE